MQGTNIQGTSSNLYKNLNWKRINKLSNWNLWWMSKILIFIHSGLNEHVLLIRQLVVPTWGNPLNSQAAVFYSLVTVFCWLDILERDATMYNNKWMFQLKYYNFV